MLSRIVMRLPTLLTLTTLLSFHASTHADAGFTVETITVDPAATRLAYPAEEGFYYILYRGDDVESISKAIDVSTKANVEDKERADRRQAFYRLEKVPTGANRDTDGDGLADMLELDYPGILSPIEAGDAALDFDNDGKTNKQELTALFGASDPGDAVFEDITFKTADNFTITASLGIPQTLAESIPAIIFIHQGGSDRSEWDTVAKQAFRKGWATLAYDIRGHGESSGSWTNAWYDDPDNAPKDLEAALAHLKSLPKVDSDRLAVVGASVGGNLACVASARYGVKTAIAISHKTSAVSNLAGGGSLAYRSVYHLSSSGDQGGQRATWAQELFEQTAEPKKLEITEGSGHGVSIFKTDPTVPDRLISWLQDTL